MRNNTNMTRPDLSLNSTTVARSSRCRRTCDSIPVDSQCPREYRQCTDSNGCTALYPVDCRDPFWPEFAHPRCLPCCKLYSGRSSVCCNANR